MGCLRAFLVLVLKVYVTFLQHSRVSGAARSVSWATLGWFWAAPAQLLRASAQLLGGSGRVLAFLLLTRGRFVDVVAQFGDGSWAARAALRWVLGGFGWLLGGSWASLGRLLGGFGRLLGGSGELLGGSRRVLATLGPPLGGSWKFLELV